MVENFWIDTDMGSDDAVALMMAFQSPQVHVLGLSAVAGNVPLEQAAKNARFVAELCGSDVPVYLGADKPLLRPYTNATWFHGHDGLSGYGGDPQQAPDTSTHAVTALLEAIEQHPNLVLVTLGPLTNIALAIMQNPAIVQNIARCVVMGGAAGTYGNVTPAAEYNIWVDPEAARIVFTSGMPVEMVGWEFCQGEFALEEPEIARLEALSNPLAQFSVDSNKIAIESYFKQTGHRGISLPDPVAMAVALDRTLATQSQHYVEIETASDLTRGMTVVDKLNVAEDSRNQQTWARAIAGGKVSVTWAVDAARWKALFFELLTL